MYKIYDFSLLSYFAVVGFRLFLYFAASVAASAASAAAGVAAAVLLLLQL